jgi:electron transfer flavoprotein alpha subunit
VNQDIYVVIEHLRGQVADISYIMLAAARVLAQGAGGDVVAVLLGHDMQGLTSSLAANRVIYFDHPALADFNQDAYQKTLSSLINQDQPRAVLLGNTTIGSDVASVLSAHLELPLVSSCSTVSTDGKLTSTICGGKIMVETALPDTTTLVTMIPGGYSPEEGQSDQAPEVVSGATPDLEDLRIALQQYIEPEVGDVDISTEQILIAIGRGIQREDNIELAEELAEALGGAVCSTRPVVDQGWLPTSRLVGKSGKHVKPKLYLAFGISGAPEHVEALSDSDMIIAINTDAAAPIYDVAKYGATVDLFDLFPVLTERIQQAKSA